ncbi:Rec8 like protein-domain-containing protein [Ephemerocybe angulata]|uniref:Rec8 like protein-domain-containing protein n=1 Tax=Ephemerocybe angulata TaxID=980116 RepID=A0A8H6IIG7_9AGAR|nr:Rec8 like protein-domain-containing protein [Tulosesus angulatus]
MFFTQELLARRDSSQPTLGSKSSFKKLPKRSVLVADISKLCDLIVQPAEPLALRLSSNLMFGVVRVYKVKQEILLTDVTSCVTSLKKVVMEMNTKSWMRSCRWRRPPPSTVTLVPDSRSTHLVDYDAFVEDWDEYLNILDDKHASKKRSEESDSDEFDPAHPNKKKGKASKPKPGQPAVEDVRARDPHTLVENHEHLLSATFDLSFNAGDLSGGALARGGGASSSQNDAAFDFDENPFILSDRLDLGGEGFMLGDELAKELGWGSPAKSVRGQRNTDALQLDFEGGGNDVGFGNDFEFNLGGDDLGAGGPQPGMPNSARRFSRTPSRNSRPRSANKENVYPRNTPGSRQGSVLSNRAPSPANSFGKLFLSQDQQDFLGTPLREITPVAENGKQVGPKVPAKKRTRLLLDARTELTDEELKVARGQYLEFQNELKRDMLKKKLEKDGAKLVEDLTSGVPKEIQEPSLMDFWQANFKVQLESRSGLLTIHMEGPSKPARKKKRLSTIAEDDAPIEPEVPGQHGFDGLQDEFNAAPQENCTPSLLRVFGGDFDFEFGAQQKESGGPGSQRSSLFPWDNAGPSSSSANPGLGDDINDNNIPIDHVEIRLRGSSRSRKSFVAPSQVGGVAGPGFSPIVINGTPAPMDSGNRRRPRERLQEETQKSEVHLATLERNSFNFLEYAKMQYRSLQEGGRLTFDMVVPRDTSTRHVASAAFYHCLVLATKDLVRLEQPEPYETMVIEILNIA